VWTWGGNLEGSVPTQVPGPGGTGVLHGILAVAAGCDHFLAIGVGGTVWAWGLNRSGQLGDGTTTSRVTPAMVKGPHGALSGVVEIAAGDDFSLARLSDGSVWAWGNNLGGQLGDGSTRNSPRPVRVRGPRGRGHLVATALATGCCAEHSLAIG
jgi:alpha-tubulin suppressor-like RCC1 family protein